MNVESESWRHIVRSLMEKATLREAEERFGTRDPLFNYRWEHVSAVHTLAMRLAQLTGADEEIVEAAVWLHDIAKQAGSDHPQAGAEFARDLLPQIDFPEEKTEPVAQAIADHMGLWREEPLTRLESQVLWDADKLAKLGLTAAIHWMGLDFAKGKKASTRGIVVQMREIDWLEKCVSSMHTEPAQRAARRRLQTFNELWDTLETELDGADLEMVGMAGA